MKTVRKYKVVKTDMSGYLKFTCITAPKAWPLYIEKTTLPRATRPKVGDVVRFERVTTRTTTQWVLPS